MFANRSRRKWNGSSPMLTFFIILLLLGGIGKMLGSGGSGGGISLNTAWRAGNLGRLLGRMFFK
jgi:hypothetical protein